MSRGLAGEFAAVEGKIAQADHAGLSSKFEHLHEQRGQEFQVLLAEIADGAEVGAVVADDGQEGEVAFAGLGDLAAGVDADAVGVKQQANEHGGIEGRLAACLQFVGFVEGVQVQLGNDIQEKENEVVFGKPVGWAEWLMGIGFGVPGTILLATGDDHDESNPGQAGLAQAENTFTRLQLPPADRIGERRIPDSLLGCYLREQSSPPVWENR